MPVQPRTKAKPKMQEQLKKVLIAGDIHIPYHSQPGTDLFLQVGQGWKPDHIILLGDVWDGYCISGFSKDPNRETQVDAELAQVNDFLDALDELGASRKIWINGNHSERMERFLCDRAPQLYNMVKIQKLLKLQTRGWEFVPYRDHIQVGKVFFTHDVGNVGRNAAFKAMDTYQHSVVTGHTHRMQYVVEANATGTAMVSAQFGWLGDIHKVDYMHKIKAQKDWALGFGVGYLRDNGIMHLQPVPIVDNSCVVEGQLYTTKEGK